MPAALTELVATKTAAQFLAQILSALKGIGHTQRIKGSGLGAIVGSGQPTTAINLWVQIIASGGLGSGTFQVSQDGGQSYGGTLTIPASGIYPVAGTGVSLNFDVSNASSVDTPYIAGDVYGMALTLTTVPVTAWQPGSLPLTLLQTDADVDADLSQLVQAVAKAAFLSTATSDWLDLLAANQYNLTRYLAVQTQGLVTLTASSGVGPYSITPGQLKLATPAGIQYTNITGGTLSGSGTLQVTVQAVSPGAAANVGNTAITQLLTPLAGVTVSNPDPGSGTWITTYGADIESDSSLVKRCRDRWVSLGVGATAASYDAWARAASPDVTRTSVYADGTTVGQVDVVVAGPSGPVTGGDVTAVQNYINARLPLGTTCVVSNAVAHAITVSATIYVDAAHLALAQTQCPANLQALIAATPLGSATVYLSDIITALNSPLGVRNVVVSSPGSDVVLAAGEVATLTIGTLTFTVV
jgi:uncharacterized phage protein gp47/JayE